MEGAELGKRSATSELRRNKSLKTEGKNEKVPRDKKAPVGGDDDTYIVDEFDSSKPIDLEKDICAMCKEVISSSLVDFFAVYSNPLRQYRVMTLAYSLRRFCHRFPIPAPLISMMMVMRSS